jgi:hypothetical protein
LLVENLKKLKNVTSAIPQNLTPFISGNKITRHWCRKDGEALYVFFPNPKADRIKFPMGYGQSLETETKHALANLNFGAKSYKLDLTFEPYQSLLYKIENGKIEKIDIGFIPKTPVVKERPSDYVAPWLVK